MALSILHRMTGVFLSFGAIIIVIVLAALAMGPVAYDWVRGWLGHPLGQAFLILWSIALYLHLANGIRHLIWDTGTGLQKSVANQSGLWVVGFAVLATIATWVLAWG